MNDYQLNIYPSPTAPRSQMFSTQEFRLAELRRLIDMLNDEVSKRKKLYNRYERFSFVCKCASHGITGGTTGMAFTGMALLSLGLPVGVVMEGTAACGGMIALVLNLCALKFGYIARKHERIATLAMSKANSIKDLITKALEDNHISDTEYHVIMKENEKFKEMQQLLKTSLNCDRAQIVLEELKKHGINLSR